MASFFVNRPIVAIVISIMVVIIGAICLSFLPVSQYPDITPPEIVINANYTGADALTVERSVATPIEQQMSGVDNMNYMYSLNSNTGQMRLRVSFEERTDPNTDQVLAQMRASQASAELPPVVTQQGVTVQKSFANPLLVIALYSPDDRYDTLFLANYAYIHLNDQLNRVPGISNVQVFGAGQYAMRVWLNPQRLAQLGVTVPEVAAAIQKQNRATRPGRWAAHRRWSGRSTPTRPWRREGSRRPRSSETSSSGASPTARWSA